MDLLAKMATFVRVVESGSFASAAQQLRISSPAVSRQIATLEAELRTPLITRTTRRMVLTPAGRRYYERCVRLLREVEEAQQLGDDDAIEGPLRVSAPVTFGLACVAPHMRGLMKKHPGLLVELHLDDRLVDLTLEGFDVAIRVGADAPLSTEILGSAPRCSSATACCSRSIVGRESASRRRASSSRSTPSARAWASRA